MLDSLQNRCAGRDLTTAALPANRPAARLVADVVGILAGHKDLLQRLWQRQQLALVFEQYQRLAYGVARDGAMLWRADLRGVAPIGFRSFEQSKLEFLG